MKVLQLDILTPEKTIFSGEVTGVMVPGSEGLFKVLYNHAPMISTIGKGMIKVDHDKGSQEFEAESGVIEVLNNKVIILVESIAQQAN